MVINFFFFSNKITFNFRSQTYFLEENKILTYKIIYFTRLPILYYTDILEPYN